MSKREILVGATDQTIDVFIMDSSSTTGAGLTGLLHDSASLTCYYRKGATGTPTALTLATQTVGGAHSDGGFVAVDGTNMPGIYRLDLSDTMVSAVGMLTIMLKGAANMAPCSVEIEVVSVNKFDGVRMGMSALPNAAADAAGGLPISDTGGLDLDALYDNVDGLLVLVAVVPSAAGIADAVWDEATAGHTSAGTYGKALSDVLTDTAVIGAAGAGLTNIPYNAGWTSSIVAACASSLSAYDPATQTQLTTAISAHQTKLRKYFQLLARSDSAIATDNATELTELNASGGSGAGDYASTTDSLEGLRDRGDLSWITSTFSITAGAIADAVWDEATSGHTTSGTFGKAMSDALSNTSTLTSRLTSSRAGYLDNLNTASIVSTQADVLALNTSAARHVLLNTVVTMPIPSSGTDDFTIEGRTFDADGDPVDADSTPTLTATGNDSGDLSSKLSSATNIATGVYQWTYTVDEADAIEQVRFDLSATISSTVRTISASVLVTDLVAATFTATHASQLAAIYNKLPSKAYLPGTSNSDGDIQLDEATGGLSTQAKSDVNAEVLDVLNVDTPIDGYSVLDTLILVAATTVGKVSNAGTNTEIFQGLDDSTTRVTATVDASGNRSAVTKNV